ncbi:DUF3224 domain-containing protein [Massilia sp. YIM B04103]|uniref:DUF3224 domain-containing protein n=1 Tax=Massilia sp. YIM B04103 TaxID=2963106 RepID=UPI0035A5E7BA
MKPIFSIFLILAAQAAYAGGSNMQIQGDFDVKLTPQTSADSPPWGRQRIEKTFHGPLDGSSIGEMLAVRTEVKGSAGYVALEQVSATLEGRKGTFFLQHSGLMDHGAPTLMVSVVPDSATGELKGLKGTMTIQIEGGKHFYGFNYSLP